uniref:Dcp1-like decapping family protein n=1 Tax=Babesia bovis TaxID=5865 RepID=S6B2I5_BABBO|nr:Dcp1-like decapping family protein [Babesia bovis]
MDNDDAVDDVGQRAASNNSALDEVRRMRGRLSLKLLRSCDQHVKDIIFQTPFVTAYELKGNNEWERAGIEGFLYLLQRDAEPAHSIIVVNRKLEHHLIEYITPEFQVALEGNFIFYRSLNTATGTMHNIRGLWFYDEKECMTTYNKIFEVIINREPLSGFKRDSNVTSSNEVKQPIPSSIHGTAAPSQVQMSTEDIDMRIEMLSMKKKGGFVHPGVNAHRRISDANTTPRQEAQVQMPSMGMLPGYNVEHTAESHSHQAPPANALPIPSRLPGYNLTVKSAQAYSSDHKQMSIPIRPTVSNPRENEMDYTSFPMNTNMNHYTQGPMMATHQPSRETQSIPIQPRQEMEIKITYDMLCSAFAETMQSEEFLRLVWRRLA